MSEEKTNKPVKQEGEFTLRGKKTSKKPKQLAAADKEIQKVEVKKVEEKEKVEEEPIKVEIKKEDNAIPIGETKEVPVEKPSGDSAESNETTEGFSPIKEVTEDEVKKVEQEVKKAIKDEKVLGKQLPENVEKLVNFMEETGGTVEDYVRLNADYSNVNEKTLLTEFYKKNKPYLSNDDVELLLEEFDYDEDIDAERDVRKKKLAYKEEVVKAKTYLEDLKQKYYDEIKLRPGVTQEQKKALEFFNRYNQQQEKAEQLHDAFKRKTKDLFNDDFEGFDIKVGDKRYKYNVQNRDKIVENQSNINNLIGKFLDSDGNVTDTAGYHKAMYAAENVDKIASHFYEQGKADAVKDVVNKSKNLSDVKARQGNTGEVYIGGLKVKSISGADATKLKIKTRKFNN